MEFFSVVAAAIAAYAFATAWYMALGSHWVAWAREHRTDHEDMESMTWEQYVLPVIAMLLVAGMMRHVFATTGIESIGEGLVSGLGTGLFLASPWMAVAYIHGKMPLRLILIDLGHVTLGCTIIGVVLTLF